MGGSDNLGQEAAAPAPALAPTPALAPAPAAAPTPAPTPGENSSAQGSYASAVETFLKHGEESICPEFFLENAVATKAGLGPLLIKTRQLEAQIQAMGCCHSDSHSDTELSLHLRTKKEYQHLELKDSQRK